MNTLYFTHNCVKVLYQNVVNGKGGEWATEVSVVYNPVFPMSAMHRYSLQGSASSPDFCGSPPIVSNAAHNASLNQEFFDVDTVLSYRCRWRGR